MSDPSEQTETTVEKEIVIGQSAEVAWRVWTEQIDVWWPAGHSISGDPLTKVFIEGRVDGRVYERSSNGDEYEWGRILVWEPPQQLSYTWYLGSGRDVPSQVDITFVAVTDDQTRIELVHRGPELIGELWWARVKIFNDAWTKIIGLFGESAAASEPPFSLD